MKSEQEIKKELIDKLRSQVDLLEKGDLESICSYKKAREYILALENVLELDKLDIPLDTLSNVSKGIFSDISNSSLTSNEILTNIYDNRRNQ